MDGEMGSMQTAVDQGLAKANVPKKPEVYKITEDCHSVINEIETRSQMILLEPTPEETDKLDATFSPIELEVHSVLTHLKSLLRRYKV